MVNGLIYRGFATLPVPLPPSLPLFMMLGLFGSNQVAAIGSIAVVPGGIVSLGSNASTSRMPFSRRR
jgi:hypothetical protein